MEEKKVEEQEENEVINIKAINEGTLVLNTNLEGKKVGPCNLSITASKVKETPFISFCFKKIYFF